MLIALAATAALRHQHFLSGFAQVGQQTFTVLIHGIGQRAHRQVEHQIFAVLAVALAAHAGLAVAGLVQALEAEVIEGEQARLGPQDDRTAIAAVAAIGAAARHKFLAAEGHAAMSPLAGAYLDAGFVHKSHAGSVPLRVTAVKDVHAAQTAKGKKPCGLFPEKLPPAATGLVGGGNFHVDAGQHAALAGVLFIAHHAVDLGEQGVVPAHAHVLTGIDPGPKLTHEDVARQHLLPAKTLDAASLARTVAAVARRAACFLMSHDLLLACAPGRG